MVDALIYDDDDSAHFSAPKCIREQTPVQLHTVRYSTYPAPIALPSCEKGLDSPLILHSAVVTGNALDVLAQLPTGLCQTVITSPPYWSLRDYAIPDQFGLEAFRCLEVERVERLLVHPRPVLQLVHRLQLG